ncbi:hypothetical protein D2V93_17730 [Flagellimonas taeanensis]|nr:hypothetical protein D2V93_17730 [Allomuricauda taeanensis]
MRRRVGFVTYAKISLKNSISFIILLSHPNPKPTPSIFFLSCLAIHDQNNVNKNEKKIILK